MSSSKAAVSISKEKVAPVVLAILDGWGHSEETNHNSIKQASTPVMDALWHAYPHTLIEASGADVGLPDNQMGNSEVGHLTIGAGRIIQQELVRISNTVKENKLIENTALNQFSKTLKKRGGTLHIMGLCSDGGVHSHINHLCGLIQWAAEKDLKNLSLHLFTDGRDTSAMSASKYINKVENTIKSTGIGEISSICGRYWAMDRDNRWERTLKAYELLTDPNFTISDLSAEQSLKKSYEEGITDEFIEPVRLSPSFLKDGDGVVFFNFRPDRARQLVKALKLEDFDGFDRKNKREVDILTFTQYESGLPVSVAFPPEPLNDLLGQVVSNHGLNQYRTAETNRNKFLFTRSLAIVLVNFMISSLVSLCFFTLSVSSFGAPVASNVASFDSSLPESSVLNDSTWAILFSNLLFKVTKALIISLDTFIARRAMSTKYINPTIFCLGVSLPPPIS